MNRTVLQADSESRRALHFPKPRSFFCAVKKLLFGTAFALLCASGLEPAKAGNYEPIPFPPTINDADTVMIGKFSDIGGGVRSYDPHEVTIKIHVNADTVDGWYTFTLSRFLGSSLYFRMEGGAIAELYPGDFSPDQVSGGGDTIQVVFTQLGVTSGGWWTGQFSQYPDGAYFSERWHIWWQVNLMVIDRYLFGWKELPQSNQLHDLHVIRDEQNFYLYARPGMEDKPGPCPEIIVGMAAYDLSQMRATLMMADRPLAYHPAKGPDVPVAPVYQEQADEEQPALAEVSHLGPHWNLNALRSITAGQANARADAVLHDYSRGLSWWSRFSCGTKIVEDIETPDTDHGFYEPDARDRSVLEYDGRNGNQFYVLHFADGSQETFGKRVEGSGGKRFFPTQKSDPQGHSIQFIYDPLVPNTAKLLKIVDAGGAETVLDYENVLDPLQITKATDPFGRSAHFAYDEAGRLTSITDPVGIVSQFSYDSEGLAAALTTPYGMTSFSRSEENGVKTIEATRPDGSKERVEYHASASPSIQASSEAEIPVAEGLLIENQNLQKNVSFYWDRKAMGLIAKEGTAPSSPEFYAKATRTNWIGDAEGALAFPSSIKLPLQNRIWFNYKTSTGKIFSSRLAQPNSVLSPTATARVIDDGSTQVQKASYNDLGHVTSTTDPLGRSRSYTYDEQGMDLLAVNQTTGGINDVLMLALYNPVHQPLVLLDASAQSTTFTYDDDHLLSTKTNALQECITYSHDSLGQLTQIDGPLPGDGDSTLLAYDKGNIASLTDSEGYALHFEYDNLDRPTKTTYPDNTTEQTAYTTLDPTTLTDRRGRVTTQEFNSLRELVKVTDPSGRITQMHYCRCGAMDTLTDAMGRITKWDYDVQGRLLSKTYPDLTQILNSYEAKSGRLSSVTDALGQSKAYSYNLDDSIAGWSYAQAVHPTPSVSFTYDANYSRIASMIDGSGTTTYAYGATGQLGALQKVQETKPTGWGVLTWNYDELGRIKSKAIDGVTESRTFDSLGRIVSESNPLGPFSYHYAGATGRLLQIQRPDGWVEDREYFDHEGDDRLKQILQTAPNGKTLSYRYGYDAEGTITEWDQKSSFNKTGQQDWSLSYDLTDQLTGVNVQAGLAPKARSYAFNYDLAGNRTSANAQNTGFDVNWTGTYNDLNQLTRGHDPAPTNYRYDENGNLRRVGAGGNPMERYAWDAQNRLIRINATGTPLSEYDYDGLDRRVAWNEKQDGTVIENKKLVWSDTDLKEERSKNGKVLKRYFAQGYQVVQGLHATSYFYSRDHLGSVRTVTNDNGAIKAQLDYDPHGRIIRQEGDLLPDVQYAGMFRQPETQLYLTLYRAYDPELNRWLSRDPIEEEGGINLYGYVMDNPINYWDRYGLDTSFNQETAVGGHGWVNIGGNTPNGGDTYGAYPDGQIYGKPEVITNPDQNHGGATESDFDYIQFKTTPEDEAALTKWIKDNYDINQEDSKRNPTYSYLWEDCRSFRNRVQNQLIKIIKARGGKIEGTIGSVPKK